MTNKKPLLTVYEQTKALDDVQRLNITNTLEVKIALIEAGAEAYARKMERPACKACFTNENGDDSRELCFKCEENIRQEERSKLSSPELREKIARHLCNEAFYRTFQLPVTDYEWANQDQEYYYSKADEILSLIKQEDRHD